MKYRLIAAEKEQIPAHLRPSLDLSGPHSQFRQPLRCMRSGTCCTMTAFFGRAGAALAYPVTRRVRSRRRIILVLLFFYWF